MLGQHIALPFFVSLAAREQFDLRDSLVRERRRHNERRMSRCATQIYQATLGQQNNALAVGENNVIDLRLEFFPLKAFNRSEAHTSELTSLLRNSYAVFCLKKKKHI